MHLCFFRLWHCLNQPLNRLTLPHSASLCLILPHASSQVSHASSTTPSSPLQAASSRFEPLHAASHCFTPLCAASRHFSPHHTASAVVCIMSREWAWICFFRQFLPYSISVRLSSSCITWLCALALFRRHRVSVQRFGFQSSLIAPLYLLWYHGCC
jgi:hypothetical protein